MAAAVITSPTPEYLALCVHERELERLWTLADGWNRKNGPRFWAQVWYGYGRYPFGFKDEVIRLVGWDADTDHPEMRTTDAYSLVYDELVSVLTRPRRAIAETEPWHAPIRLINLGGVQQAQTVARS